MIQIHRKHFLGQIPAGREGKSQNGPDGEGRDQVGQKENPQNDESQKDHERAGGVKPETVVGEGQPVIVIDDARIGDHAHERHDGGDTCHFENGRKEHKRGENQQSPAMGRGQKGISLSERRHPEVSPYSDPGKEKTLPLTLSF